MEISSRDGNGDSSNATHRYGDQPVRGGTVAQLAPVVCAPATRGPTGGHRAGMEGPNRNANDQREIHSTQGQNVGANRHRSEPVRGGVVAQLATSVSAPTT